MLSGPVPQAIKLKTKGEQNIKTELIIYALAALTVSDRTQAQSQAGNAVPVTPDNFIRAESDRYFGKMVKDGSFGKFTHNRELTPIDKQLVVRSNRDTLNSTAVFDLDAGPVTITLPNAGKDFMSMQVIDEDMYTPQVIYNAGSYTFTREQVGTRYVLLGVRILYRRHSAAPSVARDDPRTARLDRVSSNAWRGLAGHSRSTDPDQADC